MLSQCVTLGARLAEPGEFTFRAFISGKLDLTQAEGVAATISATSDAQLHAAGLLRAGRLGTAANDLAQDVATQLALVEAGIDFVDQDDVVPVTPAALHTGLLRIVATLDDLLARSRSWGTVGALPLVVLWGQPSSGKSTLFNALLGRQRAVISPKPGTTRDALVETLCLDDADGRTVEALLVDVAGLDELLAHERPDAPLASLDELAQRAAGDAARNADLLLIIDDGRGVVREVLCESSAAQARLTVRTKRDLLTEAEVQNQAHTIAVSAVTGAGLSELKRAIAHALSERSVSLAGQTLALQPRHEAALRAARSHLASASSRVEPHAHERALREIELIAGDLRAALDELAALAGTMTPDDIIGRVFATFCVGK
jgi:tRNA modification GTPase